MKKLFFIDYDTVNKDLDELIKKRIVTDPKTLIAYYLYKDMIK